MKRILSLAALPLLLVGCTGSVSQADYDALRQQNDSLTDNLLQMESIIGTVTTTLDDMARQEGIIFVDDSGADVQDRQVLRSHLEAFRADLATRKQQIADLEDQLKKSDQRNSKLTRLITQLREQVAEKETKIASLEQQLADSNVTIADLRTQMSGLTQQLATVTEDKEFLQAVAESQDAMLNAGYYVVGTRSQLKDKGLTEGLFKKRANVDGLDRSLFQQIDIRNVTEISIAGRSPKLVTEKPAGTYTLTTVADGTSLLTITDPTRFWDDSKFLIIQVK